jgi:hypothetical protein
VEIEDAALQGEALASGFDCFEPLQIRLGRCLRKKKQVHGFRILDCFGERVALCGFLDLLTREYQDARLEPVALRHSGGEPFLEPRRV